MPWEWRWEKGSFVLGSGDEERSAITVSRHVVLYRGNVISGDEEEGQYET
jgi:hypothetical protein